MDNLDLSLLTNGAPILNNREKKIVSEAIMKQQNLTEVLLKINHERTMTNAERKHASSTQGNTGRTGTTGDTIQDVKLTNKDKKILREAEVSSILEAKRKELLVSEMA